MAQFRILHTNILQGFLFEGDSYPAKEVHQYSPTSYIETIKPHKPDILSLHEALIDEPNGASEMIEEFSASLALKNHAIATSEKSWYRENKYYGSALLAKEDIKSTKTIKLPKPIEKIEAIGPDGSQWVMHDKFALSIDIQIEEKPIKVISLHYFPFHHFGRRLDENAFRDIREELVHLLDPGDTPTIVVGDFNNKNVKLKDAFPELFQDGNFSEAIELETSIKGGQDQLDHILYTPDSIELVNAKRIDIPSDHYGIVADFKI